MPKRILLIDDSPLALLLEKTWLEQQGYEVRATTGVAEFEDAVGTFKPDVILTDIQMPEVKGTDLCRELKKKMTTRDIPVILFSSLPIAQLAPLAESVGADGYLSKANGLDALGAEISVLVDSILW